MKTQVYAMHVAYNGFEDKIWRKVEVSSKYTIAQLGYLILHTFDTLAYHAFEFSFKDTPYVLPMVLDECDIENAVDATQVKLQDLNLSVGDTMEMVYDYGCSQEFDIRVTSISDMAKGTGRHYPYVVEGQGRGILDDISPEQFADYIHQIDMTGESNFHVTRDGFDVIWDYRHFDLEGENILLKCGVERVRRAYEGESEE